MFVGAELAPNPALKSGKASNALLKVFLVTHRLFTFLCGKANEICDLSKVTLRTLI